MIANESVDMGELEQLYIESLKQLCQSCGISTSSKSQASVYRTQWRYHIILMIHVHEQP